VEDRGPPVGKNTPTIKGTKINNALAGGSMVLLLPE
jgi:hypothetical protein